MNRITKNLRVLHALYGFIFLFFMSAVSLSPADVAWSDSPLFQADLRLIPLEWVSYGYADSGVFSVDLRTIRTGWKSCRWADSGSFGLNLYPVRRASAESPGFAFNWLANSGPVTGVRTPLSLSAYNGLLQFDGSQWVTPFSVPNDGDAVVVLNHGWNSQPEELIPLAQAIKYRNASIYIYGWRWGYGQHMCSDANPNGQPTGVDLLPLTTCLGSLYLCWWGAPATINEIQGSMSKSFDHGRRLGDALYEWGIRPERHYVHIIGHSFGGIVSSEAAAVLKERSGSKIRQLTTLDTPGIPDIANAVMYLKPNVAERMEAIYYNNAYTIIRGGTGYPIPNRPASALNYQLNPTNMSGLVLHSEILDWYIESANASVFNCDGEPYGFGWSVALHCDPAWKIGLPTGDKEETSFNRGCMQPLTEIVGRSVNKTTDTLKVGFTSAASWAGQQAELAVDAIGSGVTTAVRLTITTGLSPMAAAAGDIQAADAPEGEAYIYQTMQIPADAQQMVLDLRFAKVGQGDVLTVSMGDEIVMTIDVAAFGQSDTYTQTPPAYIGDYAGQTATVQIALRATGAGDSEVLIDAIRFTTVGLAADVDSDGVVGLTDVLTMADYWMAVGCAAMNDCDGADTNRDGAVDLQDFSDIAEFWRQEL
jgi:pimeloyl-ACP methyl ester carboxylesterase